jgi:hypothetical protein
VLRRSNDPRVQVFGHYAFNHGLLDDSDGGILQYAIIGVTTVRAPELLPKVVQQLAHPSAAIRMSVATTLGRFAVAGQLYRSEIEQAIAKESVSEIRRVLQVALSTPGPL